jgi:hypothetical protein
MDEIEIKRGDAEHEHQDCGYEDPQDTLDYKSSILWDHNDLRPIGASQKYTGAVVWDRQEGERSTGPSIQLNEVFSRV